MGMRRRKKWALLALGLAGLLAGGGVGAAVLTSRRSSEREAVRPTVPSAGDEDETAGRVAVKTIHARRDSAFVISMHDLAKVEPYFRADLRARVAGPVRSVTRDINDPVTRGELLVEIDAPELWQDVAQKEAVVEQRRIEVTLAEKKVQIAEAAVEVAQHTIDQMKARVTEAEATAAYRKKRWERFQLLAQRTTVDPGVVDEEERDYRAAAAAVESAAAAVKKATSDWKESRASLEAARADISHKQSLVTAALRDLDRAQALAELSRITAPFDGTVVERRVDLGSFVANATTGQSEALVSIARTDIMTVVMKVPDTFAPLVTPQTEAILQLDEMPGVFIHGTVSRFTPSIQGSDRSMRVEVDLFNGTPTEYARFVGRGLATHLTPLGGAGAPGVAVLVAAAQAAWAPHRKGPNDPFPLYPRVTGQSDGYGTRRMLPGMVGTMRLLLRRFDSTSLIPSGAVFSRGGKRYLACVKDGKVELVPVRVQVDDGTLAKVAIIARPANLKVGEVEVLQDLTGTEEILLTGQGEVSPGQPIRTTPVEW